MALLSQGTSSVNEERRLSSHCIGKTDKQVYQR